MASVIPIPVGRSFRDALVLRGGGDAARCFQCATCSAVCDLATTQAAFPRRQLLWAQWGLVDRLAGDPAIWLCHQCNDCSVRCPRDARPGDAMQAIRALVVEQLGAPRFMARLVANAATTWPVLLGLPVLFWALYVLAVNGLAVPQPPLAYRDVVPQWMIYSVFLPAAAFATGAAVMGARRCWTAWGQGAGRKGSLLAGVAAVATEILGHARFSRCTAAKPRGVGHLLLMWGFVGALLTTTLLGIAMDLLGTRTPLPQGNLIKILGNVSAVLLGAGALLLVLNRVGNETAAGRSRAFDSFFLALVGSVVVTGLASELARLHLAPPLAVAIYVLHLGNVLTLFLTFPFSKFAHALYRTLALAHERLSAAERRSP